VPPQAGLLENRGAGGVSALGSRRAGPAAPLRVGVFARGAAGRAAARSPISCASGMSSSSPLLASCAATRRVMTVATCRAHARAAAQMTERESRQHAENTAALRCAVRPVCGSPARCRRRRLRWPRSQRQLRPRLRAPRAPASARRSRACACTRASVPRRTRVAGLQALPHMSEGTDCKMPMHFKSLSPDA